MVIMASTQVDRVGELGGGTPPVPSYAEAARLAVAAEAADDDIYESTALRVSAENARFMGHFPGVVSGVDLQAHMVVKQGEALPNDAKSYQLISLVGPEEISIATTVNGFSVNKAPERYGCFVKPDGVECSYSLSGVYVDAPSTIGLVYNNSLVAVAGATVEEGVLRVEQIQGVVRQVKSPRVREESGLYNGFKWRNTLVSVWEEVAQKCGFEAVEVIGARNNRWYRHENKDRVTRMRIGYDRVAKQMGFVPTNEGNWRKSLVG